MGRLIGWAAVVFVPMAKIKGASSSSGIEAQEAPRPTVIARPATVGACQVRAQLSTLFVPMTARMNFWKR